MVGVFAVVLWGLTLLLASNGTVFGGIIALICAFFGWRSLNRIQPDVFIVLPVGGYLIYLLIKFILVIVIGIFVEPFMLGKWVAGRVNQSLQK